MSEKGRREACDLAVDVLVLGGGPAGAWAAIEAAERGAKVALADKGRVGSSGATAAANTAVIDVAPGSAARERVIVRRLQRGLGLASAQWIDRMADEAHARLTRLEQWGYSFAVDEKGQVYRGALRGPDYMQILRRRLLQLGVRVLDHSPALQLLASDGVVAGARGIDRRSGTGWRASAGAVVLATGGCAFMSKALGTFGLTGDGLLMGAEVGATLSGMEFSGQYGICHQRATVTKNLIYDWATFTDAAGATLSGEDGFDIVARALPKGPVYAIIDKADRYIEEGLRRGQANILLALERQGIDPFRERFPVTLRYEGTVRGVGGLTVDASGATSIPGLFAAGDAASRVPVTGATSGGGGPNSTWAIASGVWSGAAAARFAVELGAAKCSRRAKSSEPSAGEGADNEEAVRWIEAVQAEVLPLDRSYERSAATLEGALARLDSCWRKARAAHEPGRGALRGREAASLIATARWIAASALDRRETRGIHRRLDYPLVDPSQMGVRSIRGLDRIAVDGQGATA